MTPLHLHHLVIICRLYMITSWIAVNFHISKHCCWNALSCRCGKAYPGENRAPYSILIKLLRFSNERCSTTNKWRTNKTASLSLFLLLLFDCNFCCLPPILLIFPNFLWAFRCLRGNLKPAEVNELVAEVCRPWQGHYISENYILLFPSSALLTTCDVWANL